MPRASETGCEAGSIPPFFKENLVNYSDTILPEFDLEMAKPRKVLDRVPDDKLDWRANPESNTIGWNANHLAEILGWVSGMVTMLSWDIAPPGGQPYQPPKRATRRE